MLLDSVCICSSAWGATGLEKQFGSRRRLSGSPQSGQSTGQYHACCPLTFILTFVQLHYAMASLTSNLKLQQSLLYIYSTGSL